MNNGIELLELLALLVAGTTATTSALSGGEGMPPDAGYPCGVAGIAQSLTHLWHFSHLQHAPGSYSHTPLNSKTSGPRYGSASAPSKAKTCAGAPVCGCPVSNVHCPSQCGSGLMLEQRGRDRTCTRGAVGHIASSGPR